MFSSNNLDLRPGTVFCAKRTKVLVLLILGIITRTMPNIYFYFPWIFYRWRQEKYMWSSEAEPKVRVIVFEPVTGNEKIISCIQQYFSSKNHLNCLLCVLLHHSRNYIIHSYTPLQDLGVLFQDLSSKLHLHLIMYFYVYIQFLLPFPGRRNFEA